MSANCELQFSTIKNNYIIRRLDNRTSGEIIRLCSVSSLLLCTLSKIVEARPIINVVIMML